MNLPSRASLIPSLPRLMAILAVGCILSNSTLAAQKRSEKVECLKSTEEWVLQRLNSGQEAFLDANLPTQNRGLRTEFVRNLLMGTDPRFKPTSLGVQIQGADIEGDLKLAYADVNYPVWLDACHFSGQIEIRESHFHKELTFDQKCVFRSPVQFLSVRIDENLQLRNANFDDSAYFVNVRIQGDFDGSNILFTNPKSTAQFVRFDVTGAADFQSAIFHGNFTLVDSKIDGSLDLKSGKVCRSAKVSWLKAELGVVLEDAEFLGSADLSRISTTGNLMMAGARAHQSVDLTYSAVDGDLDLTGGVFNDRVSAFQAEGSTPVFDLEFSHVKGSIQTRGTNFLSRAGQVNFGNVEAGDVDVSHAKFSGPTSFYFAHYRDLNAVHSSFLNEDATINFTQLTADGFINLTDSEFHGSADFIYVKPTVGISFIGARFFKSSGFLNCKHIDSGMASFEHARFAGTVSVGESSFSELDLDIDQWPPSHLFEMRNVSYKLIWSNGKAVMTGTPLAQMNRHASYDETAYLALEDYYKRQGLLDLADEAYVSSKRRERSEGKLGPLKKASSFFLDWLVQYGRVPAQSMIPITAVLFFGCIVFWRRTDMESQKVVAGDAAKTHYSPLWYSLDQFLPVIGLGAADAWTPKGTGFRYHYAGLHKLLGWLLVPIALAAWTGIVK